MSPAAALNAAPYWLPSAAAAASSSDSAWSTRPCNSRFSNSSSVVASMMLSIDDRNARINPASCAETTRSIRSAGSCAPPTLTAMDQPDPTRHSYSAAAGSRSGTSMMLNVVPSIVTLSPSSGTMPDGRLAPRIDTNWPPALISDPLRRVSDRLSMNPRNGWFSVDGFWPPVKSPGVRPVFVRLINVPGSTPPADLMALFTTCAMLIPNRTLLITQTHPLNPGNSDRQKYSARLFPTPCQTRRPHRRHATDSE